MLFWVLWIGFGGWVGMWFVVPDLFCRQGGSGKVGGTGVVWV